MRGGKKVSVILEVIVDVFFIIIIFGALIASFILVLKMTKTNPAETAAALTIANSDSI